MCGDDNFLAIGYASPLLHASLLDDTKGHLAITLKLNRFPSKEQSAYDKWMSTLVIRLFFLRNCVPNSRLIPTPSFDYALYLDYV